MTDNTIRVRAYKASNWHRGVTVDLFRVVDDAANPLAAGPPARHYEQLLPDASDKSGRAFEFVRIEAFAALNDSTCLLDDTLAQSLMDDLWNCGLRPTEGSGSAGALAATQSHVASLRSIIFKQLGINP